MGMTSALCVLMFQSSELVNSDQLHLIVIFMGVIAFFCFILLCVLGAAAYGGWKAYKTVSGEISLLKHKALPLMTSTQDLVRDLSPKISAITASVQGIVADAKPKVQAITTDVQHIVADVTPKVKKISENAVDISDVAKGKVRDFEATLDKANATVRDANDKTRAQIDRVDGMVASALKATSDLGNTVHRGIRMPVMEVAGVVNGLKAGLDVLLGKGGSAKSEPARRVATPGPVAVPSPGFSVNDEFDPSSNVAPSPGAAEVVERFRREQSSKL